MLKSPDDVTMHFVFHPWFCFTQRRDDRWDGFVEDPVIAAIAVILFLLALLLLLLLIICCCFAFCCAKKTKSEFSLTKTFPLYCLLFFKK